MKKFKTGFDKNNAFAEKYIIGMSFKNNGKPKYAYVTRNKNIIGSNFSKKPVDEEREKFIYNLYDVIEKKWIYINLYDVMGTTYFTHNEIKLDNFIDFAFIEDQKIIDKINKKTQNIINEKNKIKNNLIKEIQIYNKDFNKEIFENSFTLYNFERLDEKDIVFISTFDISHEEFCHNKINDIEKVIKIFKNIINISYKVAIANINKEVKSKELSLEEKEELKILKKLIKDSVDESIEKCKNAETLNQILENFPAILYPAPEFIQNIVQNSIFTITRDKLDNFYDGL